MMRVGRAVLSRMPLGAALAILMLVCAGCSRSAPEKPAAAKPAAQAKPAERQVMSEEEAAILAPFAQSTNISEAEKAWRQLVDTFHPPAIPPEWQTNEPSREEVMRFQQAAARLANDAADKARDFYTKFPTNENAENARKMEFALLSQAAQLGATNRLARLQELEETRLKDKDLTEDERLELRIGQLQRQVGGRESEGSAASLAELDKGARALYKEFPNRPEVAQLMVSAAQAWLDYGEVEKSRALAQEMARADTEEEVKTAAQELLKKLDKVGKPFSLKFTALDGREVDVQQLKGKVVLIDFWATWCRPCLVELPRVKAAYEKFHAQGFEIVGISLDDDKAALEKMLADQKMTWPQYFNAEDAAKKAGEEFGVSSIPAMWLVDKKGLLRELNAREDLAGKIAKLLAEK